MELYTMQKESSIYKYYLIEEAIIPLHMISPSAIYQLIHTLLTLRMAVSCTIHKILYNPNFGNNEHNFNEMVVIVLTFQKFIE